MKRAISMLAGIFLMMCLTVPVLAINEPAEEQYVVVSDYYELQDAIDKADNGDTIYVLDRIALCGETCTLGAEEKTVSLMFDPSVTDNLIENFSNNATVRNINLNGKSAECKNVFFNWLDTTLNLVNVNIEEIHCTGSAAIFNCGNCVVEECFFNSNEGNEAGAIYNYENATLIIRDSVFSNNNSSGNGGAIHNYGDLIVEKTEFINNYAINGGGICNGRDCSVIDSLFRENRVYAGGGAISVAPKGYGDEEDRYTEIIDCEIYGNTAGKWGSDIHSAYDTVIIRYYECGSPHLEKVYTDS